MRYLILPGVGDSGPGHWQTLWEASAASFMRVQQRDWERPRCDEWSAALEQAVADAGSDTVLVAHSLGCLLVAHWAAATTRRICAAFLVAVPDPAGPNFPAQATGFAPVPLRRLPFASLVIASSNDPYGALAFAQRCAAAWGSRIENIGAAGHINGDSGLGQWPRGRALLQALTDPGGHVIS